MLQSKLQSKRLIVVDASRLDRVSFEASELMNRTWPGDKFLRIAKWPILGRQTATGSVDPRTVGRKITPTEAHATTP